MRNQFKALLATIALPLITLPAFAADDAAMTALNSDDVAWDITEGLTTEIGPRQAATEAEARARKWAINWLTKAGFQNVYEESFMMPTWLRGEEKAWVISPFPQMLAITALGNSGSTGDAGIEGEIVYFASHADLIAAPDAMVKGKIVFIDHAMRPTQDGSSYGFAGPARWTGPNIAAKKGAMAVVIRSIGTDHHRNPHAGNTNFDKGVIPIPAGAISLPDADNVVRMIERAKGEPIRLRLLMTPQDMGMQESGNVVAEIPGSDPSLPAIIVACHLDSWDLGTGAIDDAAGCGIITAAALHATRGNPPKRTIRVLWAGAEEVGVWGGKAYGEEHGKKTPHAIALESDFGAGRIWKIDFNLSAANKPLADKLASAVARFGVSRGGDKASGGADIGAIIAAQNLAVIDLNQDGSKYFDLHHTPDDTLDKVDPAELRQNVAVWTAVLEILAQESGDIKPAE